MNDTCDAELPGARLDLTRMPGHWLLARMGKRVLRPGGVALTRRMLESLAVTATDRVVELAPGLGTTTELVLAAQPESYVGIERDEAAVRMTQRRLRPGRDECYKGVAARTGLESDSATVIFGEAMLTMQTDAQKVDIVREAHRVLQSGGRYGIHELALQPNDLPNDDKIAIQRALSDVIHVGARPLTMDEWTGVLSNNGFEVVSASTAPMKLLEPTQLIADEGVLGAIRIATNVAREPVARARVLAMRAAFRKYRANMCAVAIVARKRA